MQVKSIAEYYKGSLQYFWPSLSYNLSLISLFCFVFVIFWVAVFTKVLLYVTTVASMCYMLREVS